MGDSLDYWISQEFQNLAQVMYEYDEHLALEMIPVAEQQHLVDKSKVFRVVDTRTNTVALTFDSLASPVDILERIFNNDMKHGSVVDRMDNRNRAAEALNLSKQMDERAAMMDFSAFVIKNEKSRWHHEGRVRDEEFRDLGPVSKVIT